ncbi:hypothetical protein AGABI1DRAFT_73092 [Agaricus bisporus var. burnettii JB137-S8]|uniref:BRCT domain-containing protein n=2 Tax=Agaricus bisporus var. burnettii TaxID=192524 RepID=K5XAU4_AGABU|nr:uncharacterized protein AGABI1DRAFT_73092 [Agaricus bisporus var. burnettii JB137-S8]EKM80167.1 hypothetical protein AGABI1DRAFT_73092 [Agaricus bisporus var. burnettii JB137-S8]KAF7776036.1 hypothetical protein Agabi119p4_4429 [Agaricus bisporus var. burnettii]
MERYFSKVAKSSSLSQSGHRKPRYHPYDQSVSLGAESCSNRSVPKLTVHELNQSLLNSLSDGNNPITHSDAKDRADRVVSISTGHQVSEDRPNRILYLQDRKKKLDIQRQSDSSSNGVLRSVRAYISGYLNGTTDVEMRRIIVEAGGQTVMMITQCTHIVTSQWLSGSKTHRILTAKMKSSPYIVRPEWILDSVTTGKRQPERKYSISIDHTNKSNVYPP